LCATNTRDVTALLFISFFFIAAIRSNKRLKRRVPKKQQRRYRTIPRMSIFSPRLLSRERRRSEVIFSKTISVITRNNSISDFFFSNNPKVPSALNTVFAFTGESVYGKIAEPQLVFGHRSYIRKRTNVGNCRRIIYRKRITETSSWTVDVRVDDTYHYSVVFHRPRNVVIELKSIGEPLDGGGGNSKIRRPYGTPIFSVFRLP